MRIKLIPGLTFGLCLIQGFGGLTFGLNVGGAYFKKNNKNKIDHLFFGAIHFSLTDFFINQ